MADPKVGLINRTGALPPANDPAQKEYYEKFGRFIAAYAAAENSVHLLTRYYSGTDEQKARLIFAGQRLRGVIGTLRELLTLEEARNANGTAFPFGRTTVMAREIRACLDQLSLISERRHRLIHRMISYHEDGFKVSDAFTSKSIVNFDVNLVTLSDLKDMRFDCNIIFLTLNDVMREAGEEPTWDAENPRPPWRYKLPPQAPPKEPRLKARKERKRQRRASQRSPAAQ